MPTFTGIISDKEIIFEGITRPQAMLVFHENGDSAGDSAESPRGSGWARQGPEDVIILERYFTDIANLFQKKLSIFSSEGDTSGTGQDGAKLRSLLDEIIKVKTLIVKAGN